MSPGSISPLSAQRVDGGINLNSGRVTRNSHTSGRITFISGLPRWTRMHGAAHKRKRVLSVEKIRTRYRRAMKTKRCDNHSRLVTLITDFCFFPHTFPRYFKFKARAYGQMLTSAENLFLLFFLYGVRRNLAGLL